MRKILTVKAYLRLLQEYKALGKELGSRWRLRYGRTMDAIEKMHDTLTKDDSWTPKPKGGSGGK